MASSIQSSTGKPLPAVMNPLLLSSACSGSWQELEFLLNSGPHPYLKSSNVSASTQKPLDDVEAFLNLPSVSSDSLLEELTTDGGTALHAVATYGDSDGFLRSADIIHSKAKHLLFVQNKDGNTPLHCASEARMSRMVSHLISLARDKDTSVNRAKELLEMENKLKETALHQAVHIGNNDIVKLLMGENSDLAGLLNEGISPLYLAILLEEDVIVETLYNASHKKLSYSGQNGQNALHAAVLRGTELTEKLLKWKNDLSTQRDAKGSTPLHFAASLKHQSKKGSVCWQVLEANPGALYQPDNEGLFPIHVAASVGDIGTITLFLSKSPNTAGLRDTKGRTFLHLAVEKKRFRMVSYVCRNRSLSWILNMRDKDGNTALHLAIQAGSLLMFCSLFRNRKIHLNLTNKEGETPLDISQYKIPPGLFDDKNSEKKIHFPLTATNARSGGCRRDHFEEIYTQQLKQHKIEESEKVKESAQTICIGAVLIATVTFGATFALPGGYRADDHTNGGTPTLAGRYAFDAFIIASTLAFGFSSVSMLSLMYSGYSILNPRTRRIYFVVALYFGATSVTCFTATFAVGVYMVLAPVAHKTAIAICIMSPLVILCNKMELWIKWALLARPLSTRIGLLRTSVMVATRLLFNLFVELWPIIFIFAWAAYTRN